MNGVKDSNVRTVEPAQKTSVGNRTARVCQDLAVHDVSLPNVIAATG